tara:strand:+ start:206 stop:1189 length:984 start_codon:yes stop_codon:yes gene_type:complete
MAKQYQFPLDKSQINYEATVSFQAIKLKTFDVSSIFGSLYKTPEVEDGPAGGASTAVRDQAATRSRLEAMNNGTPGTGRIAGTGQEIQQRLDKATLYLPQAIQIVDGAAYDNIDLGLLGASTEAGMGQGSSLVNSITNGVVNNVSSMIDAFRGGDAMSSAAGRLAVTRAANFIPSEGARGAVRSGTRTTLNPNTRALFKSVPLREFTFTFKMIPTSRQETQQIKDIIKFFRGELYPEVITVGDIPAGYEFPNVFQINMMYRNTKQLATKLLPSYLRNFSATYNSSGMGFLEGGDFTEVDVSMTFIESSTLHRKLVLGDETTGEGGGF